MADNRQRVTKQRNLSDPTDVVITSHMALVLREFLSERWTEFIRHADNHGIEPNECEELYQMLD
jgi:hypothetical protein